MVVVIIPHSLSQKDATLSELFRSALSHASYRVFAFSGEP